MSNKDKEITMSVYEPEIGQAVFGQPWKEMECPSYLDGALMSLSQAWYVSREDDSNPFANTGANYVGAMFEAHAYDWSQRDCDCEDSPCPHTQPFNFKWKDLEISWYKYVGRGMSCNRIPNEAEVR
jgi:hypothetical protein